MGNDKGQTHILMTEKSRKNTEHEKGVRGEQHRKLQYKVLETSSRDEQGQDEPATCPSLHHIVWGGIAENKTKKHTHPNLFPLWKWENENAIAMQLVTKENIKEKKRLKLPSTNH